MIVRSPGERRGAVDHAAGGLIDRCPACGSAQLEPVLEYRTLERNSFCWACGRCWRVELGHVSRITPPICFGCTERLRCEAVYAADQSCAQGREKTGLREFR